MTKVLSTESDTELYQKIFKIISSISKHPENFLSVQESKCAKMCTLVKETYDFAYSKDSSNNNNTEILSKLIVEELDEEQIWQLIELRNNVLLNQFVKNASLLLSLKDDRLTIKYPNGELDSFNNETSENESTDGVPLDKSQLEHDSGEYVDSFIKAKQKRNEKQSIVDDKFFKLREMEAFLIAEDEKELSKKKGKLSEDKFNFNYFADDLESSVEENIEYKDFFDDDGGGVENDDTSNNSEYEKTETEEVLLSKNNFSENEIANDGYISEDDTDIKTLPESKITEEKSSFEHRDERLKQRIRDYEDDVLGEKPWQLKGEVTAMTRPQNSLLEEILEFESTIRPSPIVTEATNIRLEDIIKQRIQNHAWDDVELKIKPVDAPKEYRKQLVLDQEKSKESLAQIYEKEYQRELGKSETSLSKEEEPKLHKEIKSSMHALFIKLDALSNFHFTPKPVLPEPKIITNTATINLEEVAPIAVSNANQLAPEEIRKRVKGDVLGSNERSKMDKNRDRRHKKQKQKAIHKAMENRDIAKQKLGLRLSKKEEQAKLTKSLIQNRQIDKGSISKEIGAHKSSKAFFSKLQENTVIQTKPGKRPNKSKTDVFPAKNLKL